MGKGRLPAMTPVSSDLLRSGDHMGTGNRPLTPLWRDVGNMSGDHIVTTARLTKRVVECLPAKAERFVVCDTELKDFGVRVSSQGRKTYLVRDRTTGGADRRLTLATHGVMATEEAREQARRILAEAAIGGDPQGVKADRRQPSIGLVRASPKP